MHPPPLSTPFRLPAPQECLILAAFDIWQERTEHHKRRRAELLHQCAESGDEEALEEVAVVQQSLVIEAAVWTLVLNSSILSCQQYSAYIIACMPWCPSLVATSAALRQVRDERIKAAEVRAAAEKDEQQAKAQNSKARKQGQLRQQDIKGEQQQHQE